MCDIYALNAEKILRQETKPNTHERAAARICIDSAVSDGARSDSVFHAACILGKALADASTNKRMTKA